MSAIEQLLNRQGLLSGFRRQGHRLFGPCPVHEGDNPRAFVVDTRIDRWYCFTGCQRGGGPNMLARALGVEGQVFAPSTPQPERVFEPYTRRLDLRSRCSFLQNKGIEEQIARVRGVGWWPGHGMLTGCVAVRLHDIEGSPLGYAGRRLDPNQALARGKWVLPRGLPKSKLLYGHHHVQGREVVLTECPWGVLRLAQLDIDAVALLGVGLSPVQEARLAGFDRVVVLMDGDRAGQVATRTITARLGGIAVAAELPKGIDPDDLDNVRLAKLVLPFLTRSDRASAR